MDSQYPSAQPANAPPPGAPAQPPQPSPPPNPPLKKSRTGCLFWIVAGLAVLFFGCTVLLVIGLAGVLTSRSGTEVLADGSSEETQLVEQTIEGHGPNKVLLVPISGMIADMPRSSLFSSEPGMVATIHDALRAARRDPQVKVLLLDIDSPGGGITASDVIYHELKEFHEQTGKDVVTIFGDVAASGAYYVASASQRIVAHPTTVTGSIGVIMPLIGMEDLFLKIGVKARPIKSGAMKDVGSVFRDLTPEEHQMLQSIVNDYYDRFVGIVLDGMTARGVKMTREELVKYCDGSVFTGQRAKEIGFVDEIGYFEDAVRAACDQAKIKRDETRVVTYRRKAGLLATLLARSSAPPAQGLALRLGGRAADETPRFMYLWSVGEPAVQLEITGK
ncbi:MAG: signal peptide peptidase SppA [Candidatus Brocadiia bacterium]